jgi:hypothetical protein
MIQYNISIFIEHAIDSKALSAIQNIVIPQLVDLAFIDQAHTYEILSHQEPDSKGYSIQCLIPNFEVRHGDEIENLISSYFQHAFPNQFVYFPSQLKRV